MFFWSFAPPQFLSERRTSRVRNGARAVMSFPTPTLLSLAAPQRLAARGAHTPPKEWVFFPLQYPSGFTNPAKLFFVARRMNLNVLCHPLCGYLGQVFASLLLLLANVEHPESGCCFFWTQSPIKCNVNATRPRSNSACGARSLRMRLNHGEIKDAVLIVADPSSGPHMLM